MSFIRRCRNSDEDAVIHVFRETAAPNIRASDDPDASHFGSFLWCRDYLYLTTDWCFVIDDGHGTAKGYVICAPDTKDFVKRYKEQFWPNVVAKHGITDPRDDKGNTSCEGLALDFRKLIYEPEQMLLSDFPSLLERYPAHLHIDILPSHQGQGWGPRLLDRLLKELQAAGVIGVHLGMVAENHRAHKFYDRLGFERFEGMKENGEIGRKGGGVWRVKKIPILT